MNPLVGNILGAVIAFVVWAALFAWAWEVHWFAGLVWTAVPVVIAATIAAKYLRS